MSLALLLLLLPLSSSAYEIGMMGFERISSIFCAERTVEKGPAVLLVHVKNVIRLLPVCFPQSQRNSSQMTSVPLQLLMLVANRRSQRKQGISCITDFQKMGCLLAYLGHEKKAGETRMMMMMQLPGLRDSKKDYFALVDVEEASSKKQLGKCRQFASIKILPCVLLSGKKPIIFQIDA